MSDLSDERKERISDKRLTCLLEGGFRTGIMETMRKDEQIAALEDLIDARAELARVKGERDAAKQQQEQTDQNWRDLIADELGATIELCNALGLSSDQVTDRPLQSLMLERIRDLKQSALAARAPARGDAGAGREGNQ
jgi:hypothetical protein